jgi:hypothetical protein
MDPYLEAHWRDIHARLVIYASDTLQGLLPAPLRARVEESVLLETTQGIGDHPLFPDVRVVEYAPKRETRTPLGAGIVTAEPLIVDAEPEPVSETYLEIIDRESGNRVVTVIEFLSPSNKSPGRNREQYLSKQRAVCASDANLVEIDLNRFGPHTLAFPLHHVKAPYRTGYMTCVRRATRRAQAEVYLMPLSARLPVVKVPLRPEDADVPLDVQALVDQCYRNGGYEDTLNYAVDPDPPLRGGEGEWAVEHLVELGLRKKPPRKRKPRPS